MSTVGIIAEYNPFHNGHRWQINQIHAQDPKAKVIIAMSGSFTQRGEAAILNKWERAALAVQHGAALVLELPAVFALRSAQHFALGGVSLLHKTGLTDKLAFGVSGATVDSLQGAADLIDSETFQAKLHDAIAAGLSYGGALYKLLAAETNLSPAALQDPNNILAIEYLRALDRLKSRLEPIAMERQGANHNSLGIRGSFAAAGAIRDRLFTPAPPWPELSQVMPTATFNLLRHSVSTVGLPQTQRLLPAILCKLMSCPRSELAKIYGFNEGLEYKFVTAAKQATSWQDFLNRLTDKRYTAARQRRAILHLLLGITQEEMTAFDTTGARYIRPLAFSEQGRELLRQIKHRADLPVITKLSAFLTTRDLEGNKKILSPLQQMLAYDCRATDLHSLCYSPLAPRALDFTHSPVYVKSRL
ncbi:MAG: nucleotidyltransferase family protein [Selenomonadaceae bacterium]|nr:nucleotidyltransferase family protein [Selenomonadaceae bacterium]